MGKRQRQDYRPEIDRPLHKWLLVILVLLIVLVCIATSVNANQLKKNIDNRTHSYMKTVSFQVAREIDYRIFKVSQDLEMMADSLIQIGGFDAQQEFLERKTKILGFTQLAVADLEGNAYYNDGTKQNIRDNGAFQKSLLGESGVSFLENQTVMYTHPIRIDATVEGVIVGIRDKANMQALMKSESFDGNGVSCIIESNGDVLVSPENLYFFLELENIYEANQDRDLIENVEQMKIDMSENRDGDLAFTTKDGQEMLMAYNSMNTYGWVLLTMLPADILSRDIDHNIGITMLITAATLLILALSVFILLYFFRSYRRRVEQVILVDPLTGKMNNYHFLLSSANLIQSAPPFTYCMVSLNIKGFKLINENYGRAEGDNTLRYVFQMIRSQLKEGELAARGEADNFYVCLRENRAEDVQERLQKITEAINSFNIGAKVAYRFTILQGAYLVGDPSLDISAIQDRAKIARGSIKPENEGVCAFYNEDLIRRLQQETDLCSYLETSLKNGDFKVYLQPKIRLSDGRISGAEALVRWLHPQLGLIPPDEFIPLFEKNGTISKVDRFVFEKTCAFQEERMQQGKELFPISVNLSRYNFKNRRLLEEYDDIRKQHHLPRGVMELELTESIIFDGSGIEYVRNMIKQMHKTGFACSLDDFGFGYSSLGLLSKLEVDTIKLDKIFFTGDARSEAVVESMVALCRKLKIETVAEGIESPAQLEFLRRIGCDMVQGFVYARPMPIAEFIQWAEENPSQKF